MEDNIAILIPCYNEEQTITNVINSFTQALPTAQIYVYDNNSSDNTVNLAKKTNSIVRHESKQGKGFVVRRMFSDIDADYYILVDGDDTYDASSANLLIEQIKNNQLDMIVARRDAISNKSYPTGHIFGNLIFNKVVSWLFGNKFTDIFSGYRVFSRKFIKSFPCFSRGFEIETEMTIHALEMNLAVEEIPTPYSFRPIGSESKLNTLKDGFKILITITRLFKQVKPLLFFSTLLCLFASTSIALFIPILIEYLQTGLVPRFPTTILVASLMLVGIICFFSGVILESIAHARRQNNWLCYLAQK